MTKAERRDWVYNRYKNSSCTSVERFYASCSDTKLIAECTIKRGMTNDDGTRYRIVGGNCFHFQCAYCFQSIKTGKWYLKYITKGTETDYELTEEEVNELHLR